MQGQNREYRVVCSKIRHSDNIFVDIAATDELHSGVTHEMLFYTRRRLCGVPIEDCGVGSVFLTDNGQDTPIINFAYGPHAPKKSLEYQAYEKLCAQLQPEILATFRQMREENKTSTLSDIMGVPEVEAYKDMLAAQERILGANGEPMLSDAEGFVLREKRRRQQFAEKHRDLLHPKIAENDYAQSFEEEHRQEVLEDQAGIIQRRLNQMQDQANREAGTDVIEIMRRKMYSHDGD